MSHTSQNSVEGSLFSSPSKSKKPQSTCKKNKGAVLGPNHFASSYYAKVIDLTDQENMVKSKNLREQIQTILE